MQLSGAGERGGQGSRWKKLPAQRPCEGNGVTAEGPACLEQRDQRGKKEMNSEEGTSTESLPATVRTLGLFYG